MFLNSSAALMITRDFQTQLNSLNTKGLGAPPQKSRLRESNTSALAYFLLGR